MDMRNSRCNGFTHTRVKFSQSEESALPRGGGGGVNFSLLLVVGVGVEQTNPQFDF